MEKFKTSGIEFTHFGVTDKELELFRKGVEDLMNKYKVFYVQASLSPFKKKK